MQTLLQTRFHKICTCHIFCTPVFLVAWAARDDLWVI